MSIKSSTVRAIGRATKLIGGLTLVVVIIFYALWHIFNVGVFFYKVF